MKNIIYTLGVVAVCLNMQAQNPSEYIYGEVYTKSNSKYKGFIRWGSEELAWHDVFNSVKVSDKETNRYYKHLEKEEDKSFWKDFNWNISSIWEDKYRQTAHTFACFFGDIKAIYPGRDGELMLELKNGTKMKLDGGSNDVGTTLVVYDYKLGKLSIDWNKIEKIAFMQAPYMTGLPYGNLLYGTLDTYRKGSFEGYLKWDLDERTDLDVLDGYSEDGEQEISFSKIKKIKKYEQGALVYDVYGREYYLKGTNDVNSSNRGIAMYVDGVGRIEIPWKEFKSFGFYKPKHNGPSYSDFLEPSGIDGTVLTYNGDEYNGKLVFDIDEKWELEFLDGDDDNIKYQIPFRHIRTIYPKNKAYSIVILNNGKELLLGERQDVSGNNDGLLVFEDDRKEPRLIKWADITELTFHHR